MAVIVSSALTFAADTLPLANMESALTAPENVPAPATIVVASTLVAVTLVVLTLPTVALPVTARLVKVPRLVIAGCAAVRTGPNILEAWISST